MYYMHTIDVDATFMQMTAKKGIKRHVEISIASMYKIYTQLAYVKVMEELEPESITE